MTREQINQVFDYLENECNKQDLFEFRITKYGTINAYFKGQNKTFAEFYPERILQIIEGGYNAK
ncbi:MAG: hypothetical protein IKL08_06005 [Clostridia bacterium]|nr:hypothetical protein [Clostridia bacterium]